MKDEGVIKFNCNWIKSEPLNVQEIKDLNIWRDKLYKLGLIGVNKEGIGYGNISVRFQKDKFIITGSATGKFEKLTPEHYTQVTKFSVEENTLTTIGPVKASSESLTHAMIYQCEKSANAVIHVHQLGLWQKLMLILPATNRNVAYGTPAMAREISRLFNETSLSTTKIFAMAGHEEGIISFGRDLNEAGQILLDQLMQL
jgi:L-ribulose-5-phosphate 4-epimerase